ncbi:HIT family protein [Microbacterium sp. gxy059]|uniref:HIT family protein n=1 Tax=Microbacterium sp. gxy059 TaxID=2957199 RepID=UPI003D95986D
MSVRAVTPEPQSGDPAQGGGPVSDWRADRVGSAVAGTNPTVLAELDAAFAVIGDVQWLPGYSLALTKTPGADRLSDLPRAERIRYLADVDLIATAVEDVCRGHDAGFRRINIEILGNHDAFLHAHIWPRYEWEPSEIVAKPVWMYSPDHWTDERHRLGPAHDRLRADLTREILRLRQVAEYRMDS